MLAADTVLDYGVYWGEDAQVAVDGADQLADSREAAGEPCGTRDAEDSAEHYGAGGADGVGQSAGEHAAEGCHAYEGDGVKAHHAAAFTFFDDGLDDGVAGGHLLQQSEAADQHQKQRNPEGVRQSE